MFGIYCNLIGQSIKCYISYESSTKISKYPNDTLAFPAVSICDENFIALGFYKDDPTMQKVVLEIFSGQTGNIPPEKIAQVHEKLQNHTVVSYVQDGGPRMNSFIFHCRFNNKVINCTDYFRPMMSEANLCFTFQPDYLIKQVGQFVAVQPGFLHGLGKTITMEFNVCL
jgi:hypothetical protein